MRDKSTSAEMCQGRDLNETICLKSVRMETQSEIESGEYTHYSEHFKLFNLRLIIKIFNKLIKSFFLFEACEGDQGSPLQRQVNGKATGKLAFLNLPVCGF